MARPREALQVLRDDRADMAARDSRPGPRALTGRQAARHGPDRDAPGRRLFVGVPLPHEAAAEIGSIVEGVRAMPLATGARDVRWVRLDGLHLTLRFLGPTLPDRLDATTEAVRRAAQSAAGPFEIELAGAGSFPPGRRPRALWIGIADGTEPLGRPRALDAGRPARRRLAGGEERPFRPHLTVARSDGVPAGALVADRLATAMADRRIRCAIDQLGLFESITGGGPARYVPVALFALGASPGADDDVYHQRAPEPVRSGVSDRLVTSAQRARLVLSLGILNLVLATIVLGARSGSGYPDGRHPRRRRPSRSCRRRARPRPPRRAHRGRRAASSPSGRSTGSPGGLGSTPPSSPTPTPTGSLLAPATPTLAPIASGTPTTVQPTPTSTGTPISTERPAQPPSPPGADDAADRRADAPTHCPTDSRADHASDGPADADTDRAPRPSRRRSRPRAQRPSRRRNRPEAQPPKPTPRPTEIIVNPPKADKDHRRARPMGATARPFQGRR